MTVGEAMRDADEIGTPREKVLAQEVRRLRGENLDLRAKLHDEHVERIETYAATLQPTIIINVREG